MDITTGSSTGTTKGLSGGLFVKDVTVGAINPLRYDKYYKWYLGVDANYLPGRPESRTEILDKLHYKPDIENDENKDYIKYSKTIGEYVIEVGVNVDNDIVSVRVSGVNYYIGVVPLFPGVSFENTIFSIERAVSVIFKLDENGQRK